MATFKERHERQEHLKRVRGLVFASCTNFGLTRTDRLNVATMVLNREVESFSSFSWEDWHRMADAMTGAVFVADIQITRKQARQARAQVEKIKQQQQKEESQ